MARPTKNSIVRHSSGDVKNLLRIDLVNLKTKTENFNFDFLFICLIFVDEYILALVLCQMLGLD